MLKKMKGGISESPWTIWAVIIFAAVIVAGSFFLNSYYIDYAAFLKTPPERLKALEATNAVRGCLLNGKPYVTKDFLDENSGEDIDDLCGFEDPGTEADVLDTQTGQKWGLSSSLSKADHSVWIPIAYTGFQEITDVNYALSGEYVIHAKWLGVGVLNIKANDVILELYPSALYPGGSSKLESVTSSKVREWIEKLVDADNPEGTQKADLTGMNIMAIIPSEYSLKECSSVGDLLSHEACVKMFTGVKEIHLGRLNVDVTL
ncbi:MAG: hypothetical protein NTU57_05255 [Candidatus Aenigmarchaeota archaeon]|nr:hypothetical protein [Candidatus Aenigmarchaeota archaeon]